MLSLSKGIESLPLTLTNSIYFFNSNSKILDISTINSVRSNNLSFKYQRFTPSDCKDLKDFWYLFESFLRHSLFNFIAFVRNQITLDNKYTTGCELKYTTGCRLKYTTGCGLKYTTGCGLKYTTGCGLKFNLIVRIYMIKVEKWLNGVDDITRKSIGRFSRGRNLCNH